jgi:fructose-specific phosphotransferase system IIB component
MSMIVVAVTACPTGIAHTYMAAEQLEKTARKLGYQIKVETQGAMGVENELSDRDIASADVVILASDVALEKSERFERVSIVRVSVRDAISNAAEVFREVQQRYDDLQIDSDRTLSAKARPTPAISTSHTTS